MPRITYIAKRFAESSMDIISHANAILCEYRNQGFVLTLRQLYYQFVSRDLLPNNQKSYDRLGRIINDARLAGMVDWSDLTDRTRNLRELQQFDGPQDALDKLAGWYHIDMWKNQSYRPEVWIEKDALVGVIEGVCQELDVPFFSCRGYVSQSEMWAAGRRMKKHHKISGQTPYVIHLGDHDPSGIDMTRDIESRLGMFAETSVRVQRIALNMDQIELYGPPPNPTKITDSRANDYISKFGENSWELDALNPQDMIQLIRATILDITDGDIWKSDVEKEEAVTARLFELSRNWEKVV